MWYSISSCERKSCFQEAKDFPQAVQSVDASRGWLPHTSSFRRVEPRELHILPVACLNKSSLKQATVSATACRLTTRTSLTDCEDVADAGALHRTVMSPSRWYQPPSGNRCSTCSVRSNQGASSKTSRWTIPRRIADEHRKFGLINFSGARETH